MPRSPLCRPRRAGSPFASSSVIPLAVALWSAPVAADEALAAPLYVTNLSPLAGMLGLPAQRAAEVGAPGSWQLALHGAIANHFVVDRQSGESVHFDGETDRLLLELRHAFASHWEIQLELPWVRQNKGFLDGTIDGWHEFWDLPENGRDEQSRKQFDYSYRDNAASPARRLQSRHGGDSGIGDIGLALQYQLYQREGATLAAVAGYKFGSGDRNQFTGSGKGDAYTALRLSAAITGALDWYSQLGYLRAGAIGGRLKYRQQRDLWFGGFGLSWQFAERWALLGQLDANRAPFDSALGALGDTAVMLTGGLRWQPASAWTVDLSLIEDIAVETAPDVTFQASLRYRPGG